MISGLLPVGFYARDAVSVARDLLGCTLRTAFGGAVTSGRIVEVEAYVGAEDPAAHGFRGRRSARNECLFGPPGTSYVYFIYGMHWCFNAVVLPEGVPAAVLIRALEPLEGLETMRERRGSVKDGILCAGPSRLSQALGINGDLNGVALTGEDIAICGSNRQAPNIETTLRIGITKAKDWPLRFIVKDSRWVSRKASPLPPPPK